MGDTIQNSLLRCIIVDDEPIASDILKSFIDKTSHLNLIKIFNNPLEAHSTLPKLNFDILFLDITMPHINGIELSKLISTKAHLIFTTAYSEFAVESYNVQATDYLLKPIAYTRFLKAIKKCENSIQKKSNILTIKSGYETLRIPLDDIIYIKSEGNYILIILENEKHLCLETLKNIQNELPENFCQLHRSYIVNSKYIKSYDSYEVKTTKGILPIGKNFEANFIDLMRRV